ncbi:23S rRNA (adenine(2030)-N(6))-methyltransferase RlmJ [Paludibacterium paludis]|uniref:Ribosomal RNA large subunit methyltransferase J n=1 Tax=Paludibacterium paludis TaxID=1225769 RepID=A0A918UAK9_9NEIS|nr:23S rRNA (adenine(2030)-N(6))-methyltransferase RlmJ [Paludibacterium paludis]GGY17168.1 ribosomal RNA large subunit methyltransferase J [Paludibacterium paludis]
MLSYRHAFHAGNHADVLKHFVQIEIIRHMAQKPTPFWYIDTHAGAGLYALDTGYAAQNAEYRDGIGRLWDRDVPDALAPYLETVRALNPDGQLRHYPGSPWCAHLALPPESRLRLFELHPSDFTLLDDNCRTLGRRARVAQEDGFHGIKALLPPPTRRALILIDPPYEDKRDYLRVPLAVAEGLKRFATGVYAIWYPLLQRAEMQALPGALKALPANSWLDVTLTVKTPSNDGFGMHGSGMFILNPPWTLKNTLAEVMPFLAETLAGDSGAGFTLDARES